MPAPSVVDQLGAAPGPTAHLAEDPNLLERDRQIGGLVGIGQRFTGQRGGQALQRRIEQHRVDAVTAVSGGLVRQHDFGFRAAACAAHDAGQRGERLPVVQTGGAQCRIQVGGREHRAGVRRRGRYARCFRLSHFDFRHRVADPGSGGRPRVDLDANLVAVLLAAAELRGQLCRLGERQHLLDLDTDAERRGRQPEGLAGGGQGDFAETGAGHDRLSVHLVVEHVRDKVGADVGGEHMIAARRQLDVGAEQRVGAGRLPVGRCRCGPVADVLPRSRRQVDEFLCGVRVLGSGDRRRPDGGQLRVERQGLGVVARERSRHDDATARLGRLQRAVDGVAEQRVRADFDEGRMRYRPFQGLRDGLAEPHRVAQVDHPVVRIELRVVRLADRADQRNLRRHRLQVGQRVFQLAQDRVDGRVMRGHVHLDAARQLALSVDDRDNGVHLVGRAGDHRLLRCRVHRHRDVGVLPHQLLGLGRAQLQQRHRTLTGQPRHQLRPCRNDFQAVGGAQRTGNDGGGHLTHRVADHRVGLDPVGAPQRGQRQLHTHQHRLNAVDTDHRLTGQQHVLERKTNLGNKIRFQLVDRRCERRLVGQQLPTHTGPLRTLARVQEHGALAARNVVRGNDPGGWLAGGQRP